MADERRPRPQSGTGELAPWVRDLDRRYVGPTRDVALPDDDALLRTAGDYRAYDRIRADDRVAPAYDQRFSLLLDRPWEVQPGGDEARDREAAEHLSEALRKLPWDSITEQMLWAVHYGHSVAECVWDASGPMVEPAQILVRRRGRFWWRADRDRPGEWQLLLRTLETPYGEPMPARKFWTLARGCDHADNPYGQGLARILYWLDVFKREELKFWLVYSDKFASPTSQAKHRRGASQDEVDDALRVAKSIHGQSAVAVPEDMELLLLETSRSAAGDFESFVRLLGEAQTRTVLTETMTAEDGSSLSQAQVHEEMLGRVVARDAYLIEESFARGPAKWLTEWNFPGAAVPRVKRIADSLAGQAKRAERDKLIAEMGWRPTKEYVEETYGVRIEAAPAARAPAATPPTAAALASPEAAALDDVEMAMAAIDDEDWDALAAPIVEPILRMARDEPQRLLGDLSRVYPHMDSTALAERLARAIFVARVWGRLKAEEEG